MRTYAEKIAHQTRMAKIRKSKPPQGECACGLRAVRWCSDGSMICARCTELESVQRKFEIHGKILSPTTITPEYRLIKAAFNSEPAEPSFICRIIETLDAVFIYAHGTYCIPKGVGHA